MTDTAISPLRQRMIEDMTVRGFTPGTQRGYIVAVRNFTAFLGRSPDEADAEDLRRYQLHMRSCGASATSMNAAVSALRFFFGVTLQRNDANAGMTTVREPNIEHCRTAALGGHVAACEKCGHTHIAYNSCRNRHCPKCQGAAAKDWLAARQAELLPVEYYHVVFTLPAPIADIA